MALAHQDAIVDALSPLASSALETDGCRVAASPTKSTTKYSTRLNGKRTSISLEAEFWSALKEIARSRRTSHHAMISENCLGAQAIKLVQRNSLVCVGIF